MERNILIVEDEESMRQLLTIMLSNEGYGVTATSSLAEASATLSTTEFDLIITDLWLGDDETGGIKLLRQVHEVPNEIPTIVITAHGSVDTAIEAMKLGACEYLLKPFKNEELKILVHNGLERKQLKEENKLLHRELKRRDRIDNLVGTSAAMQEIKAVINKVAPLSSTTLIQGESGTGKELVARAIHSLSPRAAKPFVAINCGGIPETLLESELFGHIKGAFTGAIANKTGLFKAADSGTLLLDEIGETSHALQVKLLRVMDEMKIRPVGSSAELPVDVRIISATNTDIEKKTKDGEFREDFLYRLNVIPIWIPPLRERREDIPLLVKHFLRQYSAQMDKNITLTDEVLAVLKRYHWPGNVRELENVIERAIALCSGDRIEPSGLPDKVLFPPSDADEPSVTLPPDGIDLDKRIEDLERALINQAMARAKHSHVRAAKLLSVTPRSLRYKLEKHSMK